MPVETYFYEILDISPGAAPEEIKKAYRKMSLKWHPDKNPDNKIEAEERFKLIAQAYSVLSDPELRQRYDRHGEEGLRRNFQSNNGGGGSSYGSAGNGGAYGGAHAHGGGAGFAFSFRAADDLFREFFGGRDPFGPMFAMDPFFGADPFADSFFSQAAAGPGGMRANGGHGASSSSSSSHVPIERERRPYAGTGFSMFGGGGFPSMFEASFGGSAGTMPANGSFSFMSSSTMGGAGGLRGAAGPSVRTFVQIADGVKIQITEEDDGRGNKTVTKVTPDGRKEITVNGVPQQQQQQQQSSGRNRINTNQYGNERRSRQNSDERRNERARSRSRSNSGKRTSTAYNAPPQSRPQASRHEYGHDKPERTKESDNESVVEVDVVEIDDSTSSDSEKYSHPPPAEPSQRKQPLSGSTHKVSESPEFAPPSKRVDTSEGLLGQKQAPIVSPTTKSSSAAAKTAAATAATAAAAAGAAYALGTKNRKPLTSQKSEAEGILATARNQLRPAYGRASSDQGSHIFEAAGGQQPHVGLKDKLKATGASMLRSRPKINRTAPPSPRSYSAPQTATVPAPTSTRSHRPVYRPGPVSAAELRAGYGYDDYLSSQQQQQQQAPSSLADNGGQGLQSFASYRNPSVAAHVPQHPQPPPPQQVGGGIPQAARPPHMGNQHLSGHSTPGHKQPRSRDRMRSTLHYDNFASLNTEAAKAASSNAYSQLGASAATLLSPPPQPQHPFDARAAAEAAATATTAVPDYSQQNVPPSSAQTHGQATFVDPGAQPRPAYYSGKPLSARQLRNQQQQQQPQQQSQPQQQPMPTGGYYRHHV